MEKEDPEDLAALGGDAGVDDMGLDDGDLGLSDEEMPC